MGLDDNSERTPGDVYGRKPPASGPQSQPSAQQSAQYLAAIYSFLSSISSSIPPSDVPPVQPSVLPSTPFIADEYIKFGVADVAGNKVKEATFHGRDVGVKKTRGRAPRLHALIIGIDDYPNLPKLKGAVADADEVSKFLVDALKVPQNQIITLRNSTATRKNIIKHMKSFQKNRQIHYEDPILVYFAGHGGSIKASERWRKRTGIHQVQVIFPFDYDIVNASSDPVECIPDRTIAGLLSQLAQAKGNNITVIFDSGHSAPTTQKPTTPTSGATGRRERSAEVKRDIPWEIDSDIVRPELGIFPQPQASETRPNNLTLRTNQASYIYLSGCGSCETAWEEDGRGVFTMTLLRSMRAYGVDTITYRDLIKSLPSLSSPPAHCYGKNQERILFSSSVPSEKTLIIPVGHEDDGIVLQAGAASGVTTGSIWEIYDSVAMDGVLLGTFRADRPHVLTTLLKPEEEGGDELYLAYIQGDGYATRTFACQVKVGAVGELRVYFSLMATRYLLPVNRNEQKTSDVVGFGEKDVGYVITLKDTADLAVDLNSEGLVTFRMCDRQAEHYGVAMLHRPMRVDRGNVEMALFAVAKWKWYLQRKNTDPRQMTDLVTMELISMGEQLGMGKKMYAENEREIMNVSGIVDIEANRKKLYGIRLTNRVRKPLYIRMFYFDTADFSIHDLFGHTGSKDPIVTGETFLIGDGGKGGTPFHFEVGQKDVLELGYMKVFWSTKLLDLRELAQAPAFDRQSRKWGQRGGCDPFAEGEFEWGTAVLTLVQRSPQPGIEPKQPNE